MSLDEWLTQFKKTSSTTPPLDLYFLGDGVGESIIAILQDKFVAVIDAYGGTHTSITKTLLNKLGVSAIDYLQVSHLHFDHYCGLHTLIDNFEIKGFGRPNLVKFIDIAQVARFIEMKNENSKDEKATSVVKFLSKIKDLQNNKWISENPAAYKHVGNATQIHNEMFSGQTFLFDCIAPLATMSEKYLENLDKIIQGLTSNGTSYIGSGLLNKFDPAINRSSVVNRIQYGNSLVVLTGDTESKVLDAYKANNLSSVSTINSLILKIPHHGSDTSDAKIIFDDAFTKDRRKIAVLCPYNSQGLPQENVLTQYIKAGYEVYRTSEFSVNERQDLNDDSDDIEPEGIVRIRLESNGFTEVSTWGSAGKVSLGTN